jgi:hypothetical protein
MQRKGVGVMPAGRPTKYSEKLAFIICERIAADESLVSICTDNDMPGLTTIYRWRDDNLIFRANYARARECQGHTVADTLGEIRKKILSGELDPQAGRAAADIAKWESGRRASKDFGDKILHGSDPENPLPQGFNVNLCKPDAQ